MLLKYSSYVILGICIGIILASLPASNDNIGFVDTFGCDPELATALKSEFYSAAETVRRCFTRYNRLNDLKWLNKRLNGTIHLRCKFPNPAPSWMADAEYINENSPQTININLTGIKTNEDSVERSAILGHETVHLIGYSHYDESLELPYITEMCCFDHRVPDLNESGQKACELFNYTEKDWNNPEYVRLLARSLTKFKRWFNALVITVAAAANSFNQTEDKNLSNEILQAGITESYPTLIFYSSKIRITDWKKTNATTQKPAIEFVVLSAAEFPGADELKKKIETRYYSHNPQAIRLFQGYGSVLKNLIFYNYGNLIKAWNHFTSLQNSNCKFVEKKDVFILRKFADYTHLILSRKRSQLQTSAESSEIFKNWFDICPLNKTN